MEITELQELLSKPADLVEAVTKTKEPKDLKAILEQYDVKGHAVMSTTKRPDKQIQTDDGQATVFVTRLTMPFQKKIVAMASTFLAGNPIVLDATPQDQLQKDLLQVLQKTWDDAKLHYETKQLAKLMFSETECAELWYTEPVDDTYWKYTPNDGARFKLRMRILANSKGDELYPVYNMMGDMIAFGRGYSIQQGDKTIKHFDLYTDKAIYNMVNDGSSWTSTTITNPFGKIPVIYYSQEAPEWNDVQTLIDQYEKTTSNHSDINEYFVSPMVKVKGEIKGFAKKGESGKILELTSGAEAEYLTWDQSPESLKLEQTNLRRNIFDLTSTPDISFENMKSLGQFSGIALKLLFMDAHMKASDKEETFGKCIQRRINYLKAALCKINVKLEPAVQLPIKPVFEYFLPKDDSEKIDNLNTAVQGGFLSKETAVSLNPLVSDASAEIERINAEGVDNGFNQP